ncbi:XRE family transcriptional regulator [Vibrio parahaemolyticus]|nr:XRE family transcriptional regulator [Vibrio parahaemolyticus]EJR2787919.1 XRE family transcriptional regulator [Vibrio parahaemolyticus]
MKNKKRRIVFRTSKEDAIQKHREVKLAISCEIANTIEKKQITQEMVGERLGIAQGRVSNIINGKVDNISLDKLFIYSYLLGVKSIKKHL